MDAARVAGGRGRPVAAREAARARSQASLGASFAVRAAFIWPALLAILFVSIYPLLASLYISLSRLKLVRGGFEFRFVGLDNFRELLVGGEQGNFLGVLAAARPGGLGGHGRRRRPARLGAGPRLARRGLGRRDGLPRARRASWPPAPCGWPPGPCWPPAGGPAPPW